MKISESKERKEFERWIKTQIHIDPWDLITYNSDSRYCGERVDMAWVGWLERAKRCNN